MINGMICAKFRGVLFSTKISSKLVFDLWANLENDLIMIFLEIISTRYVVVKVTAKRKSMLIKIAHSSLKWAFFNKLYIRCEYFVMVKKLSYKNSIF